MREYLIYKMRVKNISNDNLAQLLNVTEKTIRNKISGLTDFTWSECITIKTELFPEEEYETLFENIK